MTGRRRIRVTISQYQGWEAYSYRGPDCVLARVSDLDVATEAELAETAAGLETRAASLDVSAVPGGAGMTERDAELAAAIAAGDSDAVHRAIVEGWYGWWIDHGLVVGDEAVVQELLAVRPPMMQWVGSTFILTADSLDVCG